MSYELNSRKEEASSYELRAAIKQPGRSCKPQAREQPSVSCGFGCEPYPGLSLEMDERTKKVANVPFLRSEPSSEVSPVEQNYEATQFPSDALFPREGSGVSFAREKLLAVGFWPLVCG